MSLLVVEYFGSSSWFEGRIELNVSAGGTGQDLKTNR